MRRFLLTVVLLGGCDRKPTAELAGDISGVRLPTAAPRPGFVLTDQHGADFDFGSRTQGQLTLLFFGYTNCPDVCPATMANIGAVISRLPSADRDQISVVFVTTDPERDTGQRLGEWLARFDPQIVGLTGAPAAVEAAQRAAGVSVAIRDSAAGNYNVSHAAQVLVYTSDDSSHVAYPFGTRQAEWSADIPKLLQGWRRR